MKIVLLLFILQFTCYSQIINIFPDDAIPVKLFSEGYFTEGLAQGPDDCIYFSDLTFTEGTEMLAGNIWKYNLKTDTAIIFRSPSGMSNGIKFNSKGEMIVCEGADFGGRRITITDFKTGKSRIAAGLFNNLPFNSPNDLTIDKAGNIYFTDPRYVGYEKIEQPIMGVYRIATDGVVHLFVSDILMPNGIAISPDQKVLYVGCNFEGNENTKPLMAIYKCQLDEKANVISNEIFINYPNESGPDGITVDTDGNIYVAVRDELNPKLKVFNDEGNEIDSISLPEIPSNLTFGKSAYSNILFITAGSSLYKIKTTAQGFFPY